MAHVHISMPYQIWWCSILPIIITNNNMNSVHSIEEGGPNQEDLKKLNLRFIPRDGSLTESYLASARNAMESEEQQKVI